MKNSLLQHAASEKLDPEVANSQSMVVQDSTALNTYVIVYAAMMQMSAMVRFSKDASGCKDIWLPTRSLPSLRVPDF